MTHKIDRLFIPYRLKEINRVSEVEYRQETVAEHVYSMQILAEYFLKKITEPLNREKILRMTLYHDLVEIHAKDTFILDEASQQTKDNRELKAAALLEKELPEELAKDFIDSWIEYKEGKTREAQFCQAISELDGMMQNIYRPDLWQEHGFTEEKLRRKKEKRVSAFVATHSFFEELLTELKKRNCIT